MIQDINEIFILYGTNNLYKDVQELYLQEFEQSRIEYNLKQTREDRKIENYFNHISNSKLWDLACEFIIELGDKDFWQDKNDEYKKKMVDVYREQIIDLIEVVPDFKIANAVIHFDESSPHLHIIGLFQMRILKKSKIILKMQKISSNRLKRPVKSII